MADEFIECAVCGRNLLRGERVVEYATPERQVVKVCSLCRPAAEASGWIPAELAATTPEPSRPRRRGLGMRERISRASAAAREAALRPARREGQTADGSEPQAPPSPQKRRRAAPEPPPSAPVRRRPSPEAKTPERVMRRAVEHFNSGSQKRVVAGLIRSLGEPRVAVRVGDGGSAFVTVAWELSWYRWEISANGEGEVREAGKGREVSELSEHDRAWNASAKPDGSLRLDVAAARSGDAAG